MNCTVKSMALITLLIFASAVGVFADAPQIKATIDGMPVTFEDAKPFINAAGRTMIPVRAVTETLGAKVQWNAEKKVVIIDKGEINILLPTGKKDIVINGIGKLMDTEATIQDNRTYVPLRFVSEAFGYQVQWYGNSRTVAISTSADQVKNPDAGAIEFEDLDSRSVTAAEKNLYRGPLFSSSEVAEVVSAQFPIKLDTTTVLGVYKDEQTKTIVVELYSDTPSESDGKTISLYNSNMRLFLKDGRTVQCPGPTHFDAGGEATFFPQWYSRFGNFAAENKQVSKGPTRWVVVYMLDSFWTNDHMEAYAPSQISKIALWEDATNNGKVLTLNISELPEL